MQRVRLASFAALYVGIASGAASSSAVEPPTDFAGTALSSTEIHLTWSPPASSTPGYEIERADDTTGVFQNVANLLPRARRWTDQGLAPVTPYQYRIRAVSGAGQSPWVGPITVTTAGQSGGSVTIEGSYDFVARYLDCSQRCMGNNGDPCTFADTQLTPPIGAYVEVWDDDSTWPLAVGQIDDMGEFSIEVPNLEPGGIDPYLVIRSQNERVSVRGPGPFGQSYSERVPPATGTLATNLSNGTYDAGAQTTSHTDGTQALYLLDQFARVSWEKVPDEFANVLPGAQLTLDVHWPDRCLHFFGHESCYVDEAIYVQAGDELEPWTIHHEFGHFVHSRYIDDEQLFWGCVSNGWTHDIFNPTSPGCAWIEGFASFYADLVLGGRRHFRIDDETGDYLDPDCNLENFFDPASSEYLGSAGEPPHDDFEMVVQATLWDLHDERNEPHDQADLVLYDGSGAGLGLWNVLMEGPSPPLDITAFYDRLRARPFADDDCRFSAIAHHHLLDDVTPRLYAIDTIVDPSGAGLVQRLPNPTCPEDTYEDGTSVRLRARANAGWEFSTWTGDAAGSDTTITVTATERDKVVGAVFCAGGNCGESLVPTPNPLILSGLVDTLVTGTVQLFNPASTDLVYLVDSLEPWLTITDPGPFVVPAQGFVELELTADCPAAPTVRIGQYELTVGTTTTVASYMVENICAAYSVTPQPIAITGNLGSTAVGDFTIRNLSSTVAIDFSISTPTGIEVFPPLGTINPGDSMLISAFSGCPETAGVDTFDITLDVDGIAELLSVVRTCEDAPAPGVADWPTLAHDSGSSGYNGAETSVTPPLQAVWSTASLGYDFSYPIVVGDRVFGHCHDPSSTEFLPDLCALRLSDGALLWSRPISDIIAANHFFPSHPTVADGVLYMTSNLGNDGNVGRLYAIDTEDGGTVWEIGLDRRVDRAIPVVADGTIYLKAVFGRVWAIDAVSGIIVWTYSPPSSGLSGTKPVVVGDTLVIRHDSSLLRGLDRVTGSEKWTRSRAPNEINVDFAAGENGDRIYQAVNLSSQDWVLRALEPEFGTVDWSYSFTCTLGFGWIGPVVGPNVYLVCGVGASGGPELIALEPSTGQERLRAPITLQPDSLSMSGANSVLYVGSWSGSVAALDAATGSTLWVSPAPGSGVGSPIIANGRVLVIEDDGTSYPLVAYGP